MGLTKWKLGKLIKLSDETNGSLKYDVEDVKGISIKKTFISTKANMNEVVLSPYYIVKPNDFVYVKVTSRNAEKITLAHNNSDLTFIVSSSYIVFRVSRPDILLSSYLFIYFNRPEFDRFVRFNSWGSARETFSWSDMCNIEITLPSLEVQQKYVAVYNSLVAIRESIERGTRDLKVIQDLSIEKLRCEYPGHPIGEYITLTDRKTNDMSLSIRGISSQSELILSESRTQSVEKENYLRLDKREFGYSPIHINDGSIALNDKDDSYLLSPIYKTFKITDENKLLPEYLMMWFKRNEFTRYCWFHAFGSARDTFTWDEMTGYSIPIPPLEVQCAVVDIYNAERKRKELVERLKRLTTRICPVLIKGALREGEKQ